MSNVIGKDTRILNMLYVVMNRDFVLNVMYSYIVVIEVMVYVKLFVIIWVELCLCKNLVF